MDGSNKSMFPMNLQFFAEGEGVGQGQNTNPAGATGGNEPGGDDGAKAPSIDELMAELAKERAEKAQNKAALDKALKEKGDITKQLRARQSAEEQEAEAKKQQEEQQKAYVKSLEDKLAVIEATDRYRKLGMEEKFAKETAELEVKGDMEKVTSNIAKQMEANKKAAYDEFIKTRPDIQAGNGDGEKKSLAAEKAVAVAKRNAGANTDILANYISGGKK